MRLTTALISLISLPLLISAQLLMPMANSASQKSKSNNKVTESNDSTTGKNFIITLNRTIQEAAKNKILALLEKAGVVVVQVYDYKVYKGILFTVPSSLQAGDTNPLSQVSWWDELLKGSDGFKGVEAEQVVSIN